jgi:hypothetical protein
MSLAIQTGSQSTENFIFCLRFIPYGQKNFRLYGRVQHFFVNNSCVHHNTFVLVVWGKRQFVQLADTGRLTVKQRKIIWAFFVKKKSAILTPRLFLMHFSTVWSPAKIRDA